MREVVRAFRHAGCQIVHGRGKESHVTMARDDWPAILVIPSHGNVQRGTLRALIRQSGLSVSQFLEHLERRRSHTNPKK